MGEKAWAEIATINIVHIDRDPETSRLASSVGSGTRARPSHERWQPKRTTKTLHTRASKSSDSRLQDKSVQNDQNKRHDKDERTPATRTNANIDQKNNNKGSADKSSQIERHQRNPGLSLMF